MVAAGTGCDHLPQEAARVPRRSRRRQTEVQLHVRLYAGQDDELLRWLEQFDDRPYGAKSQAVKEALLRGIEAGSKPGEAPAEGCSSKPSVGQVELSTSGLSEVRRVVEAAVETALSRFGGQRVATATQPPVEEPDEAEALLDALGDALILKD
jgi:hypothetical protein